MFSSKRNYRSKVQGRDLGQSHNYSIMVKLKKVLK